LNADFQRIKRLPPDGFNLVDNRPALRSIRAMFRQDSRGHAAPLSAPAEGVEA